MTCLLLKRPSASRPSGEWNDEDYDLLADGIVVGHIMRVHAARAPRAATPPPRRRVRPAIPAVPW
jgi:hypothetical protein